MAYQQQLGEALVGLDVGQGDRLGQGLDGAHVDHAEPALGVGRVRVVLPDHLDDADDALFVHRVIEEAFVKKIFATAKRRFPQAPSDAKYVTIKPVVSVDKIRPKDKFKLAVVINVEKGHHIQSHTPLSAGFIATEVFVGPTNRVNLGRAPLVLYEKTRKGLARQGGETVAFVPLIGRHGWREE